MPQGTYTNIASISVYPSHTTVLGSALIQACEAAGATIPRCVWRHCLLRMSLDVAPDFVTMTDWLSRVTVGEWDLVLWDGEVVLRGSVVCAWSR